MAESKRDDDDAERQHRLTQAQLEAIEDEIKSTQPLTSPLLPIEFLVRQYASVDDDEAKAEGDDEGQRRGFALSAVFLSKKYGSLRRIRGDGNCYYRAFLYSLCENLLRSLILDGDGAEFGRLKGDVVKGSLEWVCRYGYDECTIDMFHEELVELFDFIEEASKGTSGGGGCENSLDAALKQLHARLNEENACSDYCTWFMRVVTAAQMKADAERYLPFVIAEGYADVPAFCAREVEPMGRECGMVQVSALAERMGVEVTIEYMDGRTAGAQGEGGGGGGGGRVTHHVFGEGGATSIALLYRPGHYDILY